MGETVQFGPDWWNQREDGTWMRWNQLTNDWEEAPEGPPPPDPNVLTSGGRSFESPRSPANSVVLLLAACAVLGLIALASDVAEYSLLDRAERVGITQAEADTNDSRQSVIEGVQILVILGTGVVFIFWFHRCYRNLLAFGATKLRFGTGWAISSWFLPVLDFFMPKQIANDIWRGSSASSDGKSWNEPVPGFLLAWWLVWTAGFTIDSGLWRSFDETVLTIDDLQSQLKWLIASDMLLSLAALLAIVVVRRLTERQEERASALSQQAAAPAP